MEGISTMFSTALAGADTELLATAGVAVGIGVILLVVTRGWGLIKRFTK
ncbi:hypothetical protein [Cellulomonas hominis]